MEKQLWFEKYRTRLRLIEDRSILRPMEMLEEWKLVRLAMIRLALSLLPTQEKVIIKSIYFEGMTEEKVARKLCLSRLAVHRKKWRAVKKLLDSPFVRFTIPREELE